MPSFKSLALVLSLLPVCLAGQENSADTSRFHAGQWGLQFGLGSGLVNLGILRFSSPSSALMLLFDINAEFLNGTRTNALGTSDENDRNVFFATGIGKRFYQAPRHKVRSFQSIGVAGSYSDRKQTFGTTTFTATDWRLGLLGELGGGYWVTPNLSLGGTATASAGYAHSLTDDSSTRIRQNGWFLSGVTVFLSIGFYF